MHTLRQLKSSPTLETAFNRYLIEISSKKKSLYQETSLVRAWSKTIIYDKPVGLIKPPILNRIKDEWLKYLNPATVSRRFAILSNLYTVMRRDWLWSYIPENPVILVKKPSVSNDRNRRLITDIKIKGVNAIDCPSNEIDWILQSTKSSFLPLIITLALETAMRRSELVSIRKKFIDLKKAQYTYLIQKMVLLGLFL
ncbi:hypothetical protein [Pelistega sp. MC2]|uniref:hypothetical protein n=1 Tax=Pelistega sp. MC2 TaxID=1720297 RepID=UPI0008D9C40F|nr:hypothetical protein [Pelistega sp. MC2]